MDLSIILLVYKSKCFLRQYLEGILVQDWDFSFEVIVIDNGSKDGSLEMIQGEFLNNPKYEKLNLKLIDAKKNTGHSVGNNLGMREARGKYVLMSNTDIVYLRSADIKKMLTYLDQHSEVAVLGPHLMNANRTMQDNILRFYNPLTIMYRRTVLGKTPWGKKDLKRFSMNDIDHSQVMDVDWIMGAQVLIRRDFLEKINYLDERFFLYFSDTDLCKQAWESGYKVQSFPEVEIIHYHKRESAKSLRLKDVFGYVTRIHIKDWLKYIRKWGIKNSALRISKNN